MWLAGCGSADDAGPVQADAPRVETVAEAAPDALAPFFGTPSVETGPSIGNDDPDPYGIDAAMERGERTPALEACADDTGCPEHAEARFFQEMIALQNGDTFDMDTEFSEELEALMARQEAVSSELDVDFTAVADNPEAFAAAYACLQDAESCEGTFLEERSANGEFDDYREVAAAVMQEYEKLGEATREGMQAMLMDFVELAQETASLGSPSANATLGMFYSQSEATAGEFGELIERNDALAVDYLIAAADKGSPEGSFALAQMIHVGRAGPTHDVDRLLRVAYDGNVPEAGHILLQRQRDRGKVDPELEAELGAGSGDPTYAVFSWDVHPDKPETIEARDAALSSYWEAEREMMMEQLEQMDGEEADDGTARVIGLVRTPDEPAE